jgi:hypothetical protein
MRFVLLTIAVALAACVHNPEKYVEPFGKDTYRCDDGECPHFANQYCAARGRVMQPLQSGGANGMEQWNDRNVLVFRCVEASEQRAPEVAALPSKR